MDLESMIASAQSVEEPESPKTTEKAAKALADRPWLAAIARGGVDIKPFAGRIGRLPDGTFAPGMSPNPGGRPLSVVKLIEYLTGGGAALVAQAYAVIADESRDAEGFPVIASLADKAEARKWLADRYWGKSVDRIQTEITTPDARVLRHDELTDEEFAILAKAEIARETKKAKEKQDNISDAEFVPAE